MHVCLFQEMKVQGLLGISLDEKEVFVVHINELFSQAGATLVDIQADTNETDAALPSPEEPPATPKPAKSSSKHKRPHSNSSVDLSVVKTEKDQDVIMLDTKPEPGSLSSNEHGPSSKRRMMSNLQTQQLPSGPYITGIMQHSDNPTVSWDGTQPPNTHLPPVNTLASSSSNNNINSQLPVLEQNNVTWDPSRQLTNQNPMNPQAPLDKDMVSLKHFYFALFVISTFLKVESCCISKCLRSVF